ncbi:MAG: hypothetical protein ACI9LD_001474 [Polaromonas sp.]|jgi:hypothetical protein
MAEAVDSVQAKGCAVGQAEGRKPDKPVGFTGLDEDLHGFF